MTSKNPPPEAPGGGSVLARSRLRSSRVAVAAAVVVTPLAALAILRAFPHLDAIWESRQAHFWIVLAASAVATSLGYGVARAARRRRDARLLLLAAGFIAGAGFLGLHALATPGVLIGPNAGFEMATPVGLLIAGVFVALSAPDVSGRTSRAIIRRSGWILGGLAALMIIWAAVSLAELPPLDDPLQEEELDGWQLAFGGAGVLAYAAASLGYLRVYRRRRARFVFTVTLAFALLAEAMIVIAFAQNWRISWWEWHILMLAAFAMIAFAASREWHEERFSPLYLDETLAGAKDVSILIADLQGYTAYTEATPPDEVAGMLNAYFSRIVPLMEEMNGDVHQLMGDAIMVVFNKEGDLPDHATVAARAGLALQREASAVAERHPEWPRFRAGVNSGEVVAGVVGAHRGHRKHDVVGDTVNLAARLESRAPVGEVVIGEGTYERLPPGTLVERLPPAAVKGKAAPVSAFILRAVGGEPA